MHLVIFFDALRVQIRDDVVVSDKAVYLALRIQDDGPRDGRAYDRTDQGCEVLAQGFL